MKSTILHHPEGENAAEHFVMAQLKTADLPVWLMGGVGGPAAPRESELTIHGTKASLRLGNLSGLTISTNRKWQKRPVDPTAPSSVQARLSELAQLLVGNPTTIPDLHAGLRVQEVIESVLS